MKHKEVRIEILDIASSYLKEHNSKGELDKDIVGHKEK